MALICAIVREFVVMIIVEMFGDFEAILLISITTTTTKMKIMTMLY